ncbi:3-dehydroquinate synthase [Haliovirga abyssi]|uniref:3-dehydroquinate synthase n=1 Tax=Haliovirga abyssi TaxID=2996794 RepID=A0AAU9D785_9FUSO|nr:3-dehydroquinate synthase [Haliovirga abyssi]BDU50433.1 bifunctional 3-dehydroquinate synthase/phosphatase [Haliovirga abyssi]
MKRINVNVVNNNYEILLGENTLKDLKKYLPKNYKKILIVSNDTVGPIYINKVKKALNDESIELHYFEIPDGEEYKKLDTVLPIYDYMIENNFDRSSLIISLGGGVVCDLTGYVAATFMRGIDFIQIPTSLLAQVDASIGGKVAVNHPKGKNLIGSFYQPKLVFIDIAVLKSLPLREIKTGLAEIIKHAIIKDKDYFKFLKENSDKILNLESKYIIEMIKKSCEIKAEVVSEDEKEQGIRAILNYGHTYGHVVENLTQYKVYRHGEAVVFGIMFATYLAKKIRGVNESIVTEIEEIFDKFGMDIIIPKFNFNKVLQILKHDKKVKDGKLIFVLPTSIGTAEIIAITEEQVKEVYEKINGADVKGVIDIGTNSVRLFIGEVYENNILNKFLKLINITRLGENVDKTNLLENKAIERTVNVLKEYKNISDSYGVTSLKTIATSAARDALNKDDFLKAALDVAGVKVDVVSGEVEGNYSFKGVLSSGYKSDIIVVDIGGGSTEFIYGNNKTGVKFIKSLNIGSVRIKEKFFKSDIYDNLNECKKWIFNELETIKELKDKKFKLIGVAGTITTQVTILKAMAEYNSDEVNGYNLKYTDISNNFEMLSNLSIENRKNVVGLEEKRADVIVAGTFLLKTILEFFSQESIEVSDNDILEGMILDKTR